MKIRSAATYPRCKVFPSLVLPNPPPTGHATGLLTQTLHPARLDRATFTFVSVHIDLHVRRNNTNTNLNVNQFRLEFIHLQSGHYHLRYLEVR